ncbi:hypothetical protein SBC1_63610 (plasmid) [Caballeronia sp. SBC1]|nr:hypothetical protein SBC2_63330 [Caballeronia sp. SBC2]QIN66314.1 hypothetical protein SBC1_63610 [Caballeronia sp. SBC1]
MVHCIDDLAPAGLPGNPLVGSNCSSPEAQPITPASDVVAYIERALLALASLLQLNISECDHQQN